MKRHEKLGADCFEYLRQLNPKGSIKTFIRIAAEFGYDEAMADRQKMGIGSKVTYVTGHKTEKGIIKGYTSDGQGAFVVYNCNENWEEYDQYTAANTNFRNLIPGWPAREKFECFEIHPVQARMSENGCTTQCNECKKQQQT